MVYLTLLAIGIVGGWFLVRMLYRETRLPIIARWTRSSAR